jgi:hypothetical protein
MDDYITDEIEGEVKIEKTFSFSMSEQGARTFRFLLKEAKQHLDTYPGGTWDTEKRACDDIVRYLEQNLGF